MKKKKKKPVTLIEIMIVILLIGLISGALAFNMRGSADKGRLFKTDQNCERVYDALMLALANGEITLEQCENNVEVKRVLKNSLWLKDGESLLKDAWGQDLVIKPKNDDIEVYSQKARNLRGVAPAAS